MEVILHCGAHRCATTSFQNYLCANAETLKQQGVIYWSPERTKALGLNSLDKMTPEAQSALQRELDDCARTGVRQLVVSQENFVGSMQRNLGYASLYPGVAERGKVLARAFGGRVTRLALNIRAQDTYWTSVAAYLLRKGSDPVQPERLARIANSKRSWRDVVTELGDAFPGVPLLVLPYEDFAGCQRAQLEALTGRPAPENKDGTALNGAPDPAPHGLNAMQAMKLWGDYADDLAWLATGADGLAHLICNPNTDDRGVAPAELRMEQRKPI